MLKTPSVVVGQTKTEVLNMGKNISEMFSTLKEIYQSNRSITEDEVKKMRKIEDDLDIYQKEITTANFIILNDKNITDNLKLDTKNNLEVCDEYETISDYLMRIINSLKRLQDNNIPLTEEEKNTLSTMNRDTEELFRNINTAYATKNKEMMLRSIEKANTITENYRVAKDKHLINAGCHETPIALLTTSYMDTLNYYRRVRDHIYNIIEGFEI